MALSDLKVLGKKEYRLYLILIVLLLVAFTIIQFQYQLDLGGLGKG